MSGSDVLNKILEYTGLNIKSFSEKIGLSRPQALYDIQKGKTKSITLSMANKILSVFSEFNKAWLISGDGVMLKTNENCVKIHSETNQIQKKEDSPNERWLKGNIDRLIEDGSRNSRSIEKLADAVDRNSQTLAKMFDMLEKKQNGEDVSKEAMEVLKGGSHSSESDNMELAYEKNTGNNE